MMRQRPVDLVQERVAFDAAASTYDADFDSHPAAVRTRHILWEVYRRYFRPGSCVLELNCGTGTDAVMLAQSGVRVHATDASEAMVEKTRVKIARHRLQGLVSCGILPIQKLGWLGGYEFDGCVSNFGGLNCVPNLRPVASDLSELIRPRGIVVLCLMTDFCLWETGSFLARARVRTAFRRRQHAGTIAKVGGQHVRVHYFSPRDVIENFSPFFEPVETGGLNIFVPPPSSKRTYSLLGPAVRLLEKLDDGLYRTYPFRRIGDHFFLVLRRTLEKTVR